MPMTSRAATTNSRLADWQRPLDDLRGLLAREDDWDGEGAVRPKPELVHAAIEWLQRLPIEDPSVTPPSYASAIPSGEVAIVWQTGETLLAAEFVEPHRIEWMRRVPGQPTEHWDSSAESCAIGSRISSESK